MNPSKKQRHVAVLIETEDSWGSGVIRGVSDYAKDNCQWNLLIDPRDHEFRLALPDLWKGDGIIARIGTHLQLDQIQSRGLPTVNVDTIFEAQEGIYDVVTDDNHRAEMAFKHFRDRGLREFAYFAPPSRNYSSKRGICFANMVQAAGFVCHTYAPDYPAGQRIGWEEQQRRVSSWLKSLPAPTGILTVNAYHGRQLVEICNLSGVRVPDQAAVLAADTDELMCDVSTPPLSSVALAGRKIGFEAAALLDRLLHGKEPARKSFKIPPEGVICRQSTDLLAIEDEAVVRALRFIRTHAFQDIVVKDILDEVPLSRRSLEIHFKQYLGRTPAEEIRRVRLEKGQELLARTDMSISEIALASGFTSSTRFGVAFRKRFGITPLTYRKQLQRTNS